LLILPLTPRGICRPRSTRPFLQNLVEHRLMEGFSLLRGNSDEVGEFAADNPHGMQERESVRVFPGLQRRFVHESADGKMRHHQPVEFLTHEVRVLLRSTILEPRRCVFSSSSAVSISIARDTAPPVPRRRLVGIQDTRQQPIDRLGVSHPFQSVFNHANSDSVVTLAAILVRSINRAQVGTVRQPLFTGRRRFVLTLHSRSARWREPFSTDRIQKSCDLPDTTFPFGARARPCEPM